MTPPRCTHPGCDILREHTPEECGWPHRARLIPARPEDRPPFECAYATCEWPKCQRQPATYPLCQESDKQKIARLEAARVALQQTLDEMYVWIDHFVSGERLPNGEYAHLLICSGNRQKPTGAAGSCCVCNPRLKKALFESAALRTRVQQLIVKWQSRKARDLASPDELAQAVGHTWEVCASEIAAALNDIIVEDKVR